MIIGLNINMYATPVIKQGNNFLANHDGMHRDVGFISSLLIHCYVYDS